LSGRTATSSCTAPKGQTAAQKVRPKNNATASGRVKITTTENGITYAGSAIASTTFWIAPIGQMHPSRQNPSQASDMTVRAASPVRERRTSARYVASAKAAARKATSRYSHPSAGGAGVVVVGSLWVVKSGGGKRSMAQAGAIESTAKAAAPMSIKPNRALERARLGISRAIRFIR